LSLSPFQGLKKTARPSVLMVYLTYTHSFAGFHRLGIQLRIKGLPRGSPSGIGLS